MKKLVVIALLILLVYTVLVQFAVISSEEDVYEVVRNVEVKDGGLVCVSDSMRIDPGKAIKVGFDMTLRDKLVTFYAEQATIETRYVEEEQLPSLFFIEIKNVGEQIIKASLVTIFKSLVTEEGSRTFAVDIPVLPVLKKTVKSFYMLARFPSGSVVELPERPGFNYTATMDGVFTEARDVELLSPMSVTVRFRNDKFSILSVERADVSIFIGDQRYVSFYLKIANHGKSSISEIKLLLPKGATLLKVKDNLGTLSYSYVQESGALTVKTRWELKSGEKVSFTVEYSEPHVQETDGTYIMSYPSLLDVAYEEYVLKIILPPGYNFRTTSPEPEEFIREHNGAVVLTYVNKGVATLQPKSTVSISYVAGMSFVQYLPYLWVVTFCAFLTSAIAYKLSRKPKALALPEELKETIKTLASSVLGMVRTCEKLASSIPFDKKLASRWSKSAYESELTSIKRDADRVSALKNKLGSFPEITAKLGLLETQIVELLGIMTALGRVVEDFRLGRIGKAAYERITKEYTKDVSMFASRIMDTAKDIEASLR